MPTLHKIDTPQKQRQLLAVSRDAARGALGETEGSPRERPSIEGCFGGIFVTMWKGRTLRGCIGTFAATADVVSTIEETTRATLKDHRFISNPITLEELANLEIEISILSDPVLTLDPLSLVPGTHGIVVRRGEHSGCFLPKVATERNWSAREFLSNCCVMKAGLEAESWSKPDAEVLLFTAQVFSESQLA